MFQGKYAVLVAYGTRREAIKLAPVVKELLQSPTVHPLVATSGQHHYMVNQVNKVFGITPDADLDLFPTGQSVAQVTARATASSSSYVRSQELDAVAVQGDTTTALAAALAASYQGLPVVHVEAGLRTGHRHAPFPEEMNRRLITQLASLHLAPTWANRQNLLAEGVFSDDITVTGNTVIDALHQAVSLRASTGDVEIDEAAASNRPILLVTAHRRESWADGLAAIGQAVAAVARSRPDVLVVIPVHGNPMVRERLLPPVSRLPNVRALEPLPYGRFTYLLSRASVVLTDSSGIQEEAPTFGVPVLVARDMTERSEAVDAGSATLVGTDTGAIVGALSTLLDGPALDHHHADDGRNPFGDGHAAERTRAAIEELLGVGTRLPEFEALLAAPVAAAMSS